MSIRGFSRLLLVCVALFVVIAGGITFYASSTTSSLYQQAISPESAPSVRAGLLRQVDRAMGVRGSAGAFMRFQATGDTAALDDAEAYLATAEKIIGLYANESFSGSRSEGLQELRTLLSTFNGYYEQARIRGRVPSIQNGLQVALAQFTSLIGSLHDQEVMQRLNAASTVFAEANTALLIVLLGAFAVTLAAAVVMRTRISRPLDDLARNIHDLSVALDERAPVNVAVWGTDRQDEIGSMARTFERLRRSIWQQRQEPQIPEDGVLTVQLTGPSGQMLDQVLNQLREAAGDIMDKSGALEKAWEDNLTSAGENAGRTTAAVDGLNDLHQDLVRLLADGRKNIGNVTGQLEGAASRLLEAEETVRTSTHNVLERLTEGADSLNALAGSASEHLTRTVGSLAANEGILTAALERAQTSSENLVSLVTGVNDEVAETIDVTRRESIRLSDLVDGLQNRLTKRDTEQVEQQSVFESHVKDILATITAASAEIRAVADAAKNTAAKAPETGHLEAELVRIGGQMDAVLETLSEQRAQDKEPQKLDEGIQDQLSAIAAAVESLRASMSASFKQVNEDGASASAIAQRYEKAASDIAETLTEAVGHMGKAIDDQGEIHVSLSRHHDELRESISGLGSQLTAVNDALAQSLDRGAQETDEPNGPGAIDVEDLRRCIEEVLTPFAENAAPVAPMQDETLAKALTTVAEQMSVLTERFEPLPDQIRDLEERGHGAAGLAEALHKLRGDLEARLEQVTEQLGGLVKDEAPSGLQEQIKFIEARIGEAEERAVKGGRAMVDELRGLAENIGDEARTLFEQAAQARDVSDLPETGSVVRSLKDLSGRLQEAMPVDADAPALDRAVSDIGLVAQAIGALEARCTDIARHVVRSEGAEISSGLDAAQAEQVIQQLQAAASKLGNIATAVAMAADARQRQLKAAS